VFAVQKDHRNGQDVALGHFGLIQRAIDDGRVHIRVQHRHQVDGLNHVGAVMAAQRHENLEAELALEVANVLRQVSLELGRVAADLQQGQHQRCEFMAHRGRGKSNARRLADAAQCERRTARVAAIGVQSDIVARLDDVAEQAEHFLRCFGGVDRSHDLEGDRDTFKVALEL